MFCTALLLSQSKPFTGLQNQNKPTEHLSRLISLCITMHSEIRRRECKHLNKQQHEQRETVFLVTTHKHLKNLISLITLIERVLQHETFTMKMSQEQMLFVAWSWSHLHCFTHLGLILSWGEDIYIHTETLTLRSCVLHTAELLRVAADLLRMLQHVKRKSHRRVSAWFPRDSWRRGHLSLAFASKNFSSMQDLHPYFELSLFCCVNFM